ncbi:MAG: undecaprenyl-diphosphate phosphatase [Propionibacteriaceae bacterium]|jgi:undecaprenyl-diphosphatase|nr:undecaprenyl-diphosphate phosphatase [Propionibacteriaceae bacterium]
MDWLDAVILGVVEGLTEFLPVSSTGHLTVTEKLLGLRLDDSDVTAFTAIIQVGAILAAIIYFWRDIVRLASGWLAGLRHKDRRDLDYRLGWAVIVGSIPIGVVGLALEPVIEGPLRSLYVVAGALIVWSFVLWAADKRAARLIRAGRAAHAAGPRDERSLTVVDGLIIGLAQCLALVPGVSRSGATIAIALFRGIDRKTATRWSFFLGIPALTASGLYQAYKAYDDISQGVGWAVTGLATAVSLVVAFASIAWLLKFVSSNRFTVFVAYRILAGVVILGLVLADFITAV